MVINNIQQFLEYYERVRARTLRLIAVIPPDKMDWSYKPGKFTIADIIRHLATIERYMFTESVLHDRNAYPGCGKELADGYENVVNYFNELHRQTMEALSTLSDEDLQRKCTTPAGEKMAVWKWLRAMIEHEIHHRAQLYIYLNLLDIKTPPIFGLTAEEVQGMSTANQHS